MYLINMIPIEVLNRKSPYKMLYGKQPKIDHLRVFGCLCYDSTLPRGDKFAHRDRRAVLVGYSDMQKGYKDVFPFQDEDTRQEELFITAIPYMISGSQGEDGGEVLDASQEISNSQCVDGEEVPGDLPQTRNTAIEPYIERLDEPSKSNGDMLLDLQDVVNEDWELMLNQE